MDYMCRVRKARTRTRAVILRKRRPSQSEGLPTKDLCTALVTEATRKYGNMGAVKTTLEIPDFLFRRAKSVAAERGIPLRQLVTEAVQEKLRTTSQEKPWMKHLGKLKHLHKERKQVEKRVEEAFEQIDPEVWH
jgi:RecJ-like exonuclease